MTYAIIGAGKIGKALARVFARHNLPFDIANSRGPETLIDLSRELGSSIRPVSLNDACQAEMIFLAIPFRKHAELAHQSKSWNGKILVDMMNAFGVPTEDLGGLYSSEVVAKAFTGSRLVKAFNHLPAAQLGVQPPKESQHQAIFVSGDDEQANSEVAKVATLLGFVPVELGNLHQGGAPLHVQGTTRGGLLLQNLFKLD